MMREEGILLLLDRHGEDLGLTLDWDDEIKKNKDGVVVPFPDGRWHEAVISGFEE
jgi:hypothetical protein